MRELISEYQKITDKITKLKEKIDSIYSAATVPGIKNITDMPMPQGFTGRGPEDTFIRIEELEERIAEYEKERADIAAHIEARLDVAGVSGTARVVFWYRDVHNMKWREIAAATDKSVRNLQRIYQKAIYTSLFL